MTEDLRAGTLVCSTPVQRVRLHLHDGPEVQDRSRSTETERTFRITAIPIKNIRCLLWEHFNHLALTVGMGSAVDEWVGTGPFFKTGVPGGVFSPVRPRLSSYKYQIFLNNQFMHQWKFCHPLLRDNGIWVLWREDEKWAYHMKLNTISEWIYNSVES